MIPRCSKVSAIRCFFRGINLQLSSVSLFRSCVFGVDATATHVAVLLLLLLLWLFGRSLMDGNRVRRSPSRFRLPQTSKIVDAEVDHDVFLLATDAGEVSRRCVGGRAALESSCPAGLS